jgi:hypothetical protein
VLDENGRKMNALGNIGKVFRNIGKFLKNVGIWLFGDNDFVQYDDFYGEYPGEGKNSRQQTWWDAVNNDKKLGPHEDWNENIPKWKMDESI